MIDPMSPSQVGEAVGQRMHWYGLRLPAGRQAAAGSGSANSGTAGSSSGTGSAPQLPFAALAEELQRIAAAGRSHDAYRAQVQRGQHAAQLEPNGAVRAS